MASIRSVESRSDGIFIRFDDGGGRTLNVGRDAEVIHWDENGVQFRQNGDTKYFNLKTGACGRV